MCSEIANTPYGIKRKWLTNNMVVTKDIEWRISNRPVDYLLAVSEMEQRVAMIRTGDAAELVWLVEHPPLYTAGASALDKDLLDRERFPVHRSGRGGQFTYHGPGQRVAYVMLNLNQRGRDVRRYVTDLEKWIITTLASFNVKGKHRPGQVGLWVERNMGKTVFQNREDKIAAIGIRIRHWITYHGIALNVEPNLEHYSGIVPCGISGSNLGVTSLADLGLPVTMAEADTALMGAFEIVFQERVKLVS